MSPFTAILIVLGAATILAVLVVIQSVRLDDRTTERDQARAALRKSHAGNLRLPAWHEFLPAHPDIPSVTTEQLMEQLERYANGEGR